MTINIKGHLLDLSSPKVMGILNLTPDSFFDGGRLTDTELVLKQAGQMLAEGATILDVGGMSSRPGAEIITVEEELSRVLPAVTAIIRQYPNAIVSVDTIRAHVADECLKAGAHIINDISGGTFDAAMLPVVAGHKVPFIIMHMQGLPNNMQQNPVYENVTTEAMDFLASRVAACTKAGITDLVLDPGFGFGKTVEQNYTLLRNLPYFANLNLPLLAGVSRKSMICKVLKVNPESALTGTIAANTIALLNGANLLRVHDVKDAVEAIKIVEVYGTKPSLNPPSR